MTPPIKSPPCTKKLALLSEYISDLDRHYQWVRDYAAYLDAELDVDGLAVRKLRLEISKRQLREARKRYSDHVREHGCSITVSYGRGNLAAPS